MTLRPYRDGSAEKARSDGIRNRGSKIWIHCGISICLVSLILLAAVPTPRQFLNVGTATRTLAVKDPSSYFENNSIEEYYHRFLDGGHKSRGQALDNANVVGLAASDPSVISKNKPNEIVITSDPERMNMRARGQEGGTVGKNSSPTSKAPDVTILTHHENKGQGESPGGNAKVGVATSNVNEPKQTEDSPNVIILTEPLTNRPTEGVAPTSRPSVSPSVNPSINPSSLPLKNRPMDSPPPSPPPSPQPSASPSVYPSGPPSLVPSSSPTDNPPKVFAFYVKRTRNLSEDDEQLMRAWTQAWEATGYDPRILTVDDAAQHPEYAQFSDAIDVILSASSVHRPEELKSCYLRYLAMNVAGGGMMVDLDMTPKHLASETNTTIPNKFTAYCNFQTPNLRTDWVKQVETQNGLPCAVIASSDEWMRVGKLMGWVAKQHLDHRVWTDAHALQFLTNFDEVSLVKQEMAQSWRTSGWDRCHFRYV